MLVASCERPNVQRALSERASNKSRAFPLTMTGSKIRMLRFAIFNACMQTATKDSAQTESRLICLTGTQLRAGPVRSAGTSMTEQRVSFTARRLSGLQFGCESRKRRMCEPF